MRDYVPEHPRIAALLKPLKPSGTAPTRVDWRDYCREARGQPPHITDAEFRKYFQIAAGSAEAFALTSDDFTALARNYGRMGGMDRVAALVKAVRALDPQIPIVIFSSSKSAIDYRNAALAAGANEITSSATVLLAALRLGA